MWGRRLALLLVFAIFAFNTAYSQQVKVRILKEGAVVRLLPKTDSTIIANVPVGSELMVEETYGDWIKVVLPPDKDGFKITGYIHSSFTLFDVEPKVQASTLTPTESFKRSSFSIGGGVSLPTGEGSRFWHTGWYLGFGAYGYLNRNIMLGGMISYHRWTPDEAELTEFMDNLGFRGISWDISGGASIFAIVPSIKVMGPWTETQSVNVFGQLGFGLFMIDFDGTVRGTYLGKTLQERLKETTTKPGFSISAGIVIGKMGDLRFEIVPSYNIIFTDEENTHFVTIGLLLER